MLARVLENQTGNFRPACEARPRLKLVSGVSDTSKGRYVDRYRGVETLFHGRCDWRLANGGDKNRIYKLPTTPHVARSTCRGGSRVSEPKREEGLVTRAGQARPGQGSTSRAGLSLTNVPRPPPPSRFRSFSSQEAVNHANGPIHRPRSKKPPTNCSKHAIC